MTWKEWIAANVAKAVAIAALVLMVAGLLFLRECSVERTARTETKLATGQADASLKSGADSVEHVGAEQGNEISADQITKENGDAIQNAQGASAPVAAPVRDAGLASLCRRASYRSDPKCLQLIAPH